MTMSIALKATGLAALGAAGAGTYYMMTDGGPSFNDALMKLDAILGGHAAASKEFKHDEEEFIMFIEKYGRHYVSNDEYKMRFNAFKVNLDFIENHDAVAMGSGVSMN